MDIGRFSTDLERDDSAVSGWIAARIAESDVLCVHAKEDMRVGGVIIPASDTDARNRLAIHLGYLLAEIILGRQLRLGEGRIDYLGGHLLGDLRRVGHAAHMGGGDGALFEQGQLLGQLCRVRGSGAGTQPFEIL